VIGLLWAFWLLVAPAIATQPGTEFVIVLDNSCSMVEPHTVMGWTQPPADPDRRSVLGALLVDGLTRDTEDELTVLAFPLRKKSGFLKVEGTAELRDLGAASGTYYRGSLRRARKILERSQRRDKMLLFLSDGAPNDYEDPAVGRELLGLPDGEFDTLILGLFADEGPDAESFLTPLARHPEDYVRVSDGAALVRNFTAGYARALGSKAVSGTLSPGAEHVVEVGRYVTEVLAVTTTVGRTGAYEAQLISPSGRIRPKAQGDNGCSIRPRRNPRYCDPPRLHYAVWRAPHDPTQTDRWKIRVDTGEGEVAWGLILRYDLTAEVILPSAAKVGKPTPLRGRLMWNGKVFDDAEFFGRDGFKATAMVAGESVPLAHMGDGVFEGMWTPSSSTPTAIEIRFQNDWMEKRARQTLSITAAPPLVVEPHPKLDFGRWRGERRTTVVCLPFELSTNRPVDLKQAQFEFLDVSDQMSITVAPAAQGFEACARARGCCGDLVAAQTAALRVTVFDSEGESAVVDLELGYQVDRTGFLRCWWPWLLALLILLLVLWFLYGWIRPHDFDEDLNIKIAGSERQLSRAAGLVLREQPRGRRGFYRNARVSISHAGDFVAQPRNAAVWIEATGRGDTRIHMRGPLEIKDRRTRKWVAISAEEAADGVRTNLVYRLGDIYFRFH